MSTKFIEAATPAQMTRVTADWSAIAGEPIRCELIGGYMHAFGSELAMRRLAHKMRSFRVAYSENLATWYFAND